MTIQPIQSTKRGPMRPPVLNTTIIETTLRVGSNVTITLFGLNCLHLGDIVPRTGFYCLDEGRSPSVTLRVRQNCELLKRESGGVSDSYQETHKSCCGNSAIGNRCCRR